MLRLTPDETQESYLKASLLTFFVYRDSICVLEQIVRCYSDGDFVYLYACRTNARALQRQTLAERVHVGRGKQLANH